MTFKLKSKDNLKDKKGYRVVNGYYKKTYNPKIWILQNLEKINAQIYKNKAVNGQHKFGKEQKL
jgi:hypothetical protein